VTLAATAGPAEGPPSPVAAPQMLGLSKWQPALFDARFSRRLLTVAATAVVHGPEILDKPSSTNGLACRHPPENAGGRRCARTNPDQPSVGTHNEPKPGCRLKKHLSNRPDVACPSGSRSARVFFSSWGVVVSRFKFSLPASPVRRAVQHIGTMHAQN